MAVYKVAQLGTGWAVFHIEGTRLTQVDGPYASRRRAVALKRSLEACDPRAPASQAAAEARAFDD